MQFFFSFLFFLVALLYAFIDEQYYLNELKEFNEWVLRSKTQRKGMPNLIFIIYKFVLI